MVNLKKLRKQGSDWRYAKRLWEGLGEESRPVIIVVADLSNFDDPATGSGECRSAALISVCCGALGVRDVKIVCAHEVLWDENELKTHSKEEQVQRLREELGEADVILLGSGLTNHVTKLALELLSRAEPDLKESYAKSQADGNHCVLYRGQSYFTQYADKEKPTPHTMTADYGLLLIRPNCFSDSEVNRGRIFIFAGAHTYGTQAAGEMVFSPQGAAKIAWQFNKPSAESGEQWNSHYLTGLIRVSPVEVEDGRETMALRLTQRKRTITVVEPKHLQEITILNPVMEGALLAYYNYRLWGSLRSYSFEGMSFLGILILSAGLYYHNVFAIGGGGIFYIIYRFIHHHNR